RRLVTVQLQINQSSPNAGILDRSSSSQTPQRRLDRVNMLANVLVLVFFLLSVCGDKPKPSASRVRRPSFGKGMQDRQCSAAHHLTAAFQSCEGQTFNSRGIQAPQINYAITR